MNNNQHDALFIFSLLSYHTSTCFGRISCPSSGGRMYICGKWYLLYCRVDCHRACLKWNFHSRYEKGTLGKYKTRMLLRCRCTISPCEDGDIRITRNHFQTCQQVSRSIHNPLPRHNIRKAVQQRLSHKPQLR
jgi:hypothetical protein